MAAEKAEVACYTDWLPLVPSLCGACLLGIHVMLRTRRNETDYFTKTPIAWKFHIPLDTECNIAGVGNNLRAQLIEGGARVFTFACIPLLRVISGLG